MAQQMIIQMRNDSYPFNQVVSQLYSGLKVQVRKIVPCNKYNHQQLKEKFDMARNLRHINLINLEKVLQQQGKFHLIYEYVPQSIMNSVLTWELIDTLKMKLVYVCVFLVQNRLKTQLRIQNLGIDMKDELRYYLDAQFQILKQNDSSMHNYYMQQIDRICQQLQAHSNPTDISSQQKGSLIFKDSSRNIDHMAALSSRSIKDDRFNRRYSPSPCSNSSNNSGQEASGRQRIKNTLQILNSIEMKLDQLKKNIRRHSPRQVEKPVQQQTKTDEKLVPKKDIPTVIRRFKPNDTRKYSGEVRHVSSMVKRLNVAQSARSVRNAHSKDRFMEKIHENNEDDDAKRGPTCKSSVGGSKYLRKHTVQHQKSNNAAPKVETRKRFIEDEEDMESIRIVKPTKPSAQPKMSNDTLTTQLLISSTTQIADIKVPESNRSKSKRQSQQNDISADIKRAKDEQLKERISKALKKSDEAMNRYRKLSIHSISTEFGKKNP